MIDDDGRRLISVKGRLVCPDEIAAKFHAKGDRIAQQAKLVSEKNAAVIAKISRYLATLPASSPSQPMPAFVKLSEGVP